MENESSALKKCPFCAEEIQFEAIKCKHCGSTLDEKYRIDLSGISTYKNRPDEIKKIAELAKENENDVLKLFKQCDSVYFSNLNRSQGQELFEYLKAKNLKCSLTKESDVPNLQSTPAADSNTAKCPQCGCVSIVTIKKGYSAGGGCCGAIIFGPLGLLCGGANANKLKTVCQKCGYKWVPK